MTDINIKLIIPSEHVSRVIDAFCMMYGYQAELPQEDGTTIPNPKTRADFSRDKVKDYMKEVVKAYESKVAQEAARISVVDNFSLDIN